MRASYRTSNYRTASYKTAIGILAIVAATFTHAQQAAPSVAKPDSALAITGGGTANYVPQFTGASTIGNSIIYATGNSVGIGTIPNASAKLDVGGSMIMRGTMTVSRTGNATTAKGFPSYGFDFFSNVYNSSSHATQNTYFSLQSEPTGNNTSSPASTFNLLFSNNGSVPAETGFFINPNGTLHFSPSQTFPIAAGPTGPQGPAGPTGPTGAQGPASTLTLPYFSEVNGGGSTLFNVQNTDTLGGFGIKSTGGTANAAQGAAGGTGIYAVGGYSSSTTAGTYGGEGVEGFGGSTVAGGSVGGDGAFFEGGYGFSGSSGGDGVQAYAGGSFDAKAGGVGIYASAGRNGFYAGEFNGDVHVTGNLSKAGGSFQIDHPDDPENKYLYHSFVESPDMKNVYDGTIVTDGSGTATVVLPDYFESLNRDFRYQLTTIGQQAQAWVASEVSGNRFVIRTDKGGVKVSWQITGIRQDAWANAHRIPVEVEKAEQDRGKYLHPELFGKPDEPSIEESHHPHLHGVKRTAALGSTP